MNVLVWRNSIGARLLIAALVCVACCAERCGAAPGDLLYTIPNPDAISFSEFGDVIAANADTIVIGAPETPGEDEAFVGRAYVFDAADGSLRYTLNSPVPENRQQFGWSTAIAAGRVVIGSSGLDGKAYVYTEATGEFERIIENPDSRDSFTFSRGLIAAGDNVVIGSSQHFVDEVQAAGGAFVANPASGDVMQVIENPEPTSFAGFAGGNGIAANPSYVYIGESSDRGLDGTIWGSVWAFDRESPDIGVRIPNPAPASANLPPLSDNFGASIVANDEIMVVSAHQEDMGEILDAGVLYVFDAKSRDLRLTIPNPEPSKGDEFGGAIALVNGDILVGAARDVRDGLTRAGTAYLIDGWTGQLLLTLHSPEPEEFDFFGAEVAVAGNRLIVASPNDLPVSEVFVFDGMPERVPGDTNRDGVVNIQDLNAVRNDFGVTGYGTLGDENRDGSVDIHDLNAVRNHFGNHASPVPEASALQLALMSLAMLIAIRVCR